MTNPISTEGMRKLAAESFSRDDFIQYIGELQDALTQAADELDRLRKNQRTPGTREVCPKVFDKHSCGNVAMAAWTCECDGCPIQVTIEHLRASPLIAPPTDIGER